MIIVKISTTQYIVMMKNKRQWITTPPSPPSPSRISVAALEKKIAWQKRRTCLDHHLHFDRLQLVQNLKNMEFDQSELLDIHDCYSGLVLGWALTRCCLCNHLLSTYRVFFFTGPPPKKLKYGKPRLGEVRCIQDVLGTPNLTYQVKPRFSIL